MNRVRLTRERFLMITVDVVLPCLTEADSHPAVIRALPPGCRALVVDNGSTDSTADVARLLGARVVHESRRGYGFAVHTGLEHAGTDLVAVLDADGSSDPTALRELIAVVTTGRADLALGRRMPAARGVLPWRARAGDALLAILLRRRGVPVHDIAPIRVAHRDRLLSLGVRDRASGHPLELLLRAAAAGWRVHEVDVVRRPRTAGRSKVSGSVRGTLPAARDIAPVLGQR